MARLESVGAPAAPFLVKEQVTEMDRNWRKEILQKSASFKKSKFACEATCDLHTGVRQTGFQLDTQSCIKLSCQAASLLFVV